MSERITFDNFIENLEVCLTASPLDAHQRHILNDFLAMLASRVSHELFMAGVGQAEGVKAPLREIAVTLGVEDRLKGH